MFPTSMGTGGVGGQKLLTSGSKIWGKFAAVKLCTSFVGAAVNLWYTPRTCRRGGVSDVIKGHEH